MRPKTKSNPENRAVFVKTVIELFKVGGDLKRSFARIFDLIIHPILGIGDSVYWNYRQEPDEICEKHPLPDHLLNALKLLVELLKQMCPADTARVLYRLWQFIVRLIKRANKEYPKMNTADVLLKYLDEMEDNCRKRDAR